VFSVFLAKPVANILQTTSFGLYIQNHLTESFLNKGGIFEVTITEANKTEVLSQGLQQIEMPEFLNELISKFISNFIVIDESYNVAEALSVSITHYILIGIAFVLLSIIAGIICKIFGKIFSKLEDLPIIGGLNKLLGGALNGVLGLFSVFVITYLITIVVPMWPAFSNWFADTVLLNDPEVKTFAKFCYEHNFLLKIIAWIQELLA
jgi:hypothetical protein